MFELGLERAVTTQLEARRAAPCVLKGCERRAGNLCDLSHVLSPSRSQLPPTTMEVYSGSDITGISFALLHGIPAAREPGLLDLPYTQ